MSLARIKKTILDSVRNFRLGAFYVKAELRDVADTYFVTRKKKRATPWGFILVGGNSQHHQSMQLGTFEPEETSLFLDYLKKTDVFVDVGANIGYYSALARSNNKQVVCLEPLAANLEFLYSTLLENDWADVEVFPMGVAKTPGIAKLYGASGTGASLIKNWAGSSQVFRRIIPVTTIDNLFHGRFEDGQLLIKIDVEGAEFDVLEGALGTLQRKRKPNWLVEITLDEYHPQGMNPHYLQTFDLFWRYGYVAYTADNHKKVVTRGDVETWIRNGNAGSGVINYVFSAVG